MTLDINETDLATLNAQGYTEQDLSMLAKSEIAALLDVPADESVTSDTDPHASAAAEQEAAVAIATTSEQAVATEQEKPAPFVPQYSAEVPADAKEQIAALTTEEREAFKMLMSGEIEADAYQEIRERTEAAKDELKTQALTASIFEKANAQAAEQTARAEWNRSEAQAFTSFKSEGLDYKAKPALLAAYNTNLRALGADPKNENRDAAWFLTEAHRMTKDDLGFQPVAKKVAPTTRNGVDQTELPPTLRSVPVAATGAVNADEFAHMRNLEGLALERAHAALTNDQRDRWMAE